VVSALEIRDVIAVGAYAEQRATEALAGLDAPPEITRVLHPSPASPAANRGWAEQVEPVLARVGALRDAL
jgi:single-strand selective monofunctional uracil DNA glycosylase